MDKTYGLDISDFRIQLINFTTRYLDSYKGMNEIVVGGVGLIIGNIIRRNQFTENDRKGIQEFAEKHSYTYQQINSMVEGALSAWLDHVDAFKAGVK
ncbi:hypothetical protein ACSFCX_03760 [Yokenella regensburgei]|uniref:hypothetical protein n=1 Tax=Yokenella regensburgei TaxID=158877 RepID=UPI003ED94E5B